MPICNCLFVQASEEAPAQAGCKRTPAGLEYSGTMNRTAEGLVCQQWALDTPHSHSYNNLPGRVGAAVSTVGPGYPPPHSYSYNDLPGRETPHWNGASFVVLGLRLSRSRDNCPGTPAGQLKKQNSLRVSLTPNLCQICEHCVAATHSASMPVSHCRELLQEPFWLRRSALVLHHGSQHQMGTLQHPAL